MLLKASSGTPEVQQSPRCTSAKAVPEQEENGKNQKENLTFKFLYCAIKGIKCAACVNTITNTHL